MLVDPSHPFFPTSLEGHATTMRLMYKHRLALWLAAASTSSTCLRAQAFSTRVHQAFLPRTVAAFRTRGGGFVDRVQGKQQMSSSAAAATSGESQDLGQKLRVALCQFKATEDKSVNHETCRSFMSRAIKEGAQLIVLPEIWASPYATAAFPDYAERMPNVGDTDVSISPSAVVVQEMAMQHKVWIVGGSVPERDENDKIYNTCLVFNPDGQVVAKHRKVHLFDIDVPGGITFFESETLSAGNSMTSFDTPWCPIGLGICYDIRFAAYAMLLRQETGCKILIYPGAFNMTTGPAHWELLQRARALDNQCFVLTASQARADPPADRKGKYPHYTAWGHSSAVSPWGDVLATTDEKEDVVVVDLDLSKVDSARQSIALSKQTRSDLYTLARS